MYSIPGYRTGQTTVHGHKQDLPIIHYGLFGQHCQFYSAGSYLVELKFLGSTQELAQFQTWFPKLHFNLRYLLPPAILPSGPIKTNPSAPNTKHYMKKLQWCNNTPFPDYWLPDQNYGIDYLWPSHQTSTWGKDNTISTKLHFLPTIANCSQFYSLTQTAVLVD